MTELIVEFSPKFNVNQKVYYLDSRFGGSGRFRAVFILGYALFEQKIFYIIDDTMKTPITIDVNSGFQCDLIPETSLYDEEGAKHKFDELVKAEMLSRYKVVFDDTVSPRTHYVVNSEISEKK